MGRVYQPQECADLCRLRTGCKFFIVGNDGGTEKCYWEHTSSALCPEGWDRDTYNFYQLKGKFYPTSKNASNSINIITISTITRVHLQYI